MHDFFFIQRENYYSAYSLTASSLSLSLRHNPWDGVPLHFYIDPICYRLHSFISILVVSTRHNSCRISSINCYNVGWSSPTRRMIMLLQYLLSTAAYLWRAVRGASAPPEFSWRNIRVYYYHVFYYIIHFIIIVKTIPYKFKIFYLRGRHTETSTHATHQMPHLILLLYRCHPTPARFMAETVTSLLKKSFCRRSRCAHRIYRVVVLCM